MRLGLVYSATYLVADQPISDALLDIFRIAHPLPTDRETECLLKTFAAHPAVFARARHGLLIRGFIDLLARGSARLRRSRAPLPHPPTLPRNPL
jgi:hypothetical protein